MKKRKEQKCMCGEQTTFGNANVEIGGICHRVNNPCYVIDPQPKEMKNFKMGNVIRDELFTTENGERYLKEGIGVSEIESCMLFIVDSVLRIINDEKSKIYNDPKFYQGGEEKFHLLMVIENKIKKLL